MGEYHWWNCGLVVYVADTTENRIDKFRTRRPGRQHCQFGLYTLRLGMHGAIFDERTGPGPGVFPTLAEAAEYMAEHFAKREEMNPSAGWRGWYRIMAMDWKAIATRSRAKKAKVTP